MSIQHQRVSFRSLLFVALITTASWIQILKPVYQLSNKEASLEILVKQSVSIQARTVNKYYDNLLQKGLFQLETSISSEKNIYGEEEFLKKNQCKKLNILEKRTKFNEKWKFNLKM